MFKRGCLIVDVIVLLGVVSGEAAGPTLAPPGETTGMVARVDARQNVVFLDDGRMIRATPATIIMAGGKPVTVSAVKPGTMVVIRAGEPVVLSGGQYVAAGGAAPAPATGVAPGDSPAASPAVGVRTRVFGRVKDIDKDGDVKIETKDGTFHVRVSPDAARTLKDGDTATIDVVISPPSPTVR